MRAILSAVAAVGVLCAGNVFAAEDLAKAKACMACHAVDKKLVGPAYKEVAAKYDGKDDAVEVVAGKIKSGSSGAWGPVPMPPNNVTEEEAKKLAEWVLSLK